MIKPNNWLLMAPQHHTATMSHCSSYMFFLFFLECVLFQDINIKIPFLFNQSVKDFLITLRENQYGVFSLCSVLAAVIFTLDLSHGRYFCLLLFNQ